MITEKATDIKGNRFIKVTAEPSVEPITADEVKEWARIDGTDEDTWITNTIKTVRDLTELYLGRSLIKKTIELTMDEWNSEYIELPYSPVISISKIETFDESGVATVYNSSYYYLDNNSMPARCIIKDDYTLPTNTDRYFAGYKITYFAGYGLLATDVPQTIKDAMKLWVTFIYENRSFTTEPPADVKKILFAYRVLNV